MKRAAVLIGVQKAEGFQELSAVWKGVCGMADWARKQGIETYTFTDEQSKVIADSIFEAIAELVKPSAAIDQLIIYFAGHGINKNYHEYWLLSDAKSNGNAAVNVSGSITRAQYSRVPHVVFISDACRTAVGNIQTAGIDGTVIFPNPPGGASGEVDVFYATQLGEPAFEISDPSEEAKGFTAIYTEVLLEALRGEHLELAELDDTIKKEVIRTRPLKKYLSSELPKRVFRLTLGTNTRTQKPDAIITSPSWLSALEQSKKPVPVSGEEPDTEAIAHAELVNAEANIITETTRLALSTHHFAIREGVRSSRSDNKTLDFLVSSNSRFFSQVQATLKETAHADLATKCGFISRQLKITSHAGYKTQYQTMEDGNVLAAHVPERRATSTLLTFENGHHTVLPAIGGFVANLRFSEGSLVDVSYEPAIGSTRWGEYQSHQNELCQLRAVVASASRAGTFHLEKEQGELLSHRIQYSTRIDPSLAIYAAHAYREIGLTEQIVRMVDIMRNDLGILLFDIAMLAGLLNGKTVKGAKYAGQALPLLSPTWALLPAFGVELCSDGSSLRKTVHESSLWTLYNDAGAQILKPLIDSGVIQ